MELRYAICACGYETRTWATRWQLTANKVIHDVVRHPRVLLERLLDRLPN